jgi:Uma2 family endonuclease
MYEFSPPKPLQERLPTMYDLPSEDPKEPGLPDEFHPTQAQLLRETFQPPTISTDNLFIGTDINLYYDSRKTLWYKRPDWFVSLGVAHSATIQEMRWSYVIWQETVSPFLVVELLSPGTEDEDLGQTLRIVDQPPTKWEVYERILRVPYYVVFDRDVNQLRLFKLSGITYEEIAIQQARFWLPEIELGLGVWDGVYQGTRGRWLRWYTAEQSWVPTPREQAEQEAQRAEQEAQRAEQEAQRAEQEAQRAEQEAQRAEQEAQRAEQEAQRAEQEAQRAEQEAQRAEQEAQRAERLAEQLRALGIDPEGDRL